MVNILSIFLCALTAATIDTTSTLHLMTYNIKGKTPRDTAALSWDIRHPYVAQTIYEYGADVCAIQELRASQDRNMVPDIEQDLPDYKLIYWGAESDTSIVGFCNGILYRWERIELMDSGHFFLTEDPNHAACSWDTYLPRVTVWGHFKDRYSGFEFIYMSTHLDVYGKLAKQEGARVNIEKMKELNQGLPIFLCGDLNSGEKFSAVHDQFRTAGYKDTKLIAQKVYASGSRTLTTFWGEKAKSDTRLDYIYTNYPHIKTYQIITDKFGRPFTPSDHYAVIISISTNTNY